MSSPHKGDSCAGWIGPSIALVGASERFAAEPFGRVGSLDRVPAQGCMETTTLPSTRPGSVPGYAGGVARMWRSGRFPVWISDAHEAEAKEAELRKPPSRFGTWVLRRLGYTGDIRERETHAQTRLSHERPVRRRPGS